MDYSLHSTACKHIHAVHRLDSNKASTSAEPANEEIFLNDVVSDDNYRIYSIKRRGVYFFNRLKGGGVYSRAALIRGRRLKYWAK